MKHLLIYLVVTALVLQLLFLIMVVPTVYISNATSACVEVLDVEEGYSCSNLPTTYTIVYVK